MPRLSTFTIFTALLVPAAVAHADAPITITINSNNATPVVAPVAPPPPAQVIEAPPSSVEPTPSCAAVALPPIAYVPHRAFMIGVFGGRGGAANATTDDAKTGGMRASLDLFAHRHWAFGVAGTIVGKDKQSDTVTAPIGSSLVAYVAYTHPINDKLDLRFELGGGVGALPDGATTATTDAMAKSTTTPATMDDPQQKRFLRIGEASITLTRMFGDRWGIAAGPVFTVAHPSDVEDKADPKPAHTVAFFAALERRL